MILYPYPLKCRPLYCRRYVDHIFVLFKSLVYLKRSQSYLNFCGVNMSFTIETDRSNKYHSWISMLFQKNGYPENFIDRCFELFLNRIHILKKKRSLRNLCDQSFLIQEIYHCELGLTCKSPSKGYLNAVNYRLFSKVKTTL